MNKHSLPPVDNLSLFTGYRASSHSIDVQNDYGTPNFLFCYFTPLVPDSLKNELATAHEEFRSWNAWELFFAEEQLQTQLAKKTLPTDDSIQSRVKRCSYRAKVVTALREDDESAW